MDGNDLYSDILQGLLYLVLIAATIIRWGMM